MHLRTRRSHWTWFIVLCIAVVSASQTRLLARADALIGDWFISQSQRAPASDIVIVAVDERSLQELGRWPWRRSLHAQLLDRLKELDPAVIGMDIIFSEPSSAQPDDDAQLAAAVRRASPVVLPVTMLVDPGSPPTVVEPISPIAQAASALGHVHLEVDADALVRGVFLREGAATGRWWEQFALSMLNIAGASPSGALPGVRRPLPVAAGSDVWRRDNWIQIPFAGPPGHFKEVSYVDVLEGRVAREDIAGKFVLVGATAAGLGDSYPTAVSGEGVLMSGAEIHANVLDALLRGSTIQFAGRLQNAGFTLAIMLLAAGALWLRSSRVPLALPLVMAVAVGTAYLAQQNYGVRLAPSAALLGLVLVYPLWSWQRLRTAVRYLSAESRRAHPAANHLANVRGGDELDRNMQAMSSAVAHLRELQRFVRDSFDGLPDATLVVDREGMIMLANALAVHDFEELGLHKPRGRTLQEALEVACESDDQVIIGELARADPPEAFEIEIVAKDRRDMLVKYAPWRRKKTSFDGWIVSFIDITSVREAERQRDEAMRFISHDIRSPQTSIIALLDMYRSNPHGALASSTVERIEAYARQTLNLAEEFTLLAQAESMRYEPSRMDVADVLMQAVDQHWALARMRGIEIATQILTTPAPCEGEPAMLRRALSNLVSNAVKYSPPKGRVDCTLQASGDKIRVSVRDQGRGIAPQEQGRLFQKFGRAGADDPDRPEGIGLGLAYVKAVAVRHGGSVGLHSALGEGAEFFIVLPMLEPPPVPVAVVEADDDDDEDDEDEKDAAPKI